MKIRYNVTYELEIDDVILNAIFKEVHHLGFSEEDEIDLIVKDYIEECGDNAEVVSENLEEELGKIVKERLRRE